MMPHRAGSDNSAFKLPNFFGQISWILWFFLLVSESLAERLPVKTYTVADGLLRDIVYRIRQDSRGFLWFCTAEGISRFDGYGFTNFTTDDGLPDPPCQRFSRNQKRHDLLPAKAWRGSIRKGFASRTR